MISKIGSLALHVSCGLCLLGSMANADELNDMAVGFDGMRAQALYNHLEQSYSLRHESSGQYTTVLKADSIRCLWNSASAEAPTCSLVQDGQPVAVQPTIGSLATSSLFEFLREEGAVHPQEQNPKVIVAGATKVSCLYYGHGPVYYSCSFIPEQGLAMPAPTPFNAKVTGVFANAALTAMAQAGLANEANIQYRDIRHADYIKCTAVMEDFRYGTSLTCTINAAGKTITPEESVNNTLYRLIAESGGATFDKASHAYVASASQVECANFNTHTDSPSSCTFVLASRHPVMTRFGAGFVAPQQQPIFLEAIKASGARRSESHPGFVEMGFIDCFNPSTSSNQVTDLQCSSKVDYSTAATPTTVWNNYTLFGAIVNAGGNHLDPVTLAATVVAGKDLYCYVKDEEAKNCHVSVFRTMPL